MLLKDHKAPWLASPVDRRSGYGSKLAAEASVTADARIRLMRPVGGVPNTLALDNGSDTTDHQCISPLRIAAHAVTPGRGVSLALRSCIA